MTSLEGWGSTIELHPRDTGINPPTSHAVYAPSPGGRNYPSSRPDHAQLSGVPRLHAPRADASTVQGVETIYERVGGEAFFVQLVDRFYLAVAGDPVLRPLYPDDLTEPKAHLAAFLVQYWGGPGTYSERRGHPRLRMRHAPFVIGPLERDAWLSHMGDALRAAELSADVEAELRSYFEMAAHSLMNAR